MEGGIYDHEVEMIKEMANVLYRILLAVDSPSKKLILMIAEQVIYLEEVYLVTALVPSETACLASSPGRMRRTAVWISREEMVERLL